MLPVDRGDVAQVIVGSRFNGGPQVFDGVGHVGLMPSDDGGDHQQNRKPSSVQSAKTWSVAPPVSV